MKNTFGRTDVTIIGGGLAGMAAAIHLAKAGLRVLCIESDPEEKVVIGESLDWSAPELLRGLGLPMEALVAKGIATYKRHVVAILSDGCAQQYVPSEWLGNPPWNIELRTLHVDRAQLKVALREILLSHGVTFIADRVSGVESDKKRITALTTEGGKRIDSPWFIDASGYAASLLPRTFHLPAYAQGPVKIAIWSYFAVPDSTEGTTLYLDRNEPAYTEWVWEIPIQSDKISVGYVSPAHEIKMKRQQGKTIEEIYREKLSLVPRLQRLLQADHGSTPFVTSFRCRAHRGIAGPNWLIIGEAASMIDPMTANGVTAALRHAAEASSLITKYFQRGRLPLLARVAYSRRVQAMTKFFNSGIEKIIYDWPIRNTIGLLRAGHVYTVPAWTINVIYSRLQPSGIVGTELFSLFLATFRGGACFWNWLCSLFAKPSTPLARSAV